MALKLVLDSIDDLSEEIQALYTEKDGKYHLDVEITDDAAVSKKLKEFRDKNIELMKQIEDYKKEVAKFKDIDPEKYKAAMEKVQKIEDGKLFDEGKIEELLSKRTDRMKRDYEAQIEQLTKIVDEAKTNFAKAKASLSKSTIDNQIQIEIAAVGKVRKNTMEDIIARGRRTFIMDDDDKVVARDSNGNPLFGKDGVTPLTIKEWAQNLPAEAPHFFEPSTGSEAPGGAGDKPFMSAEKLAALPPAERLKLVHSGKAK